MSWIVDSSFACALAPLQIAGLISAGTCDIQENILRYDVCWWTGVYLELDFFFVHQHLTKTARVCIPFILSIFFVIIAVPNKSFDAKWLRFLEISHAFFPNWIIFASCGVWCDKNGNSIWTSGRSSNAICHRPGDSDASKFSFSAASPRKNGCTTRVSTLESSAAVLSQRSWLNLP